MDGHLQDTDSSVSMIVSMMMSCQSRKEITDRSTETLSTTNTKIHDGFWSVMTMYATEKLAQVHVTAGLRKN